MITREPLLSELPPGRVARLGRKFMIANHKVGVATLIILKAFTYLPHLLTPRYRRMGVKQFHFTGIRSLGVLTVVALFNRSTGQAPVHGELVTGVTHTAVTPWASTSTTRCWR